MTPEQVDEDNALDRMTPQHCPAGVHADWAADCEDAHGCPWCEIARLNTLVDSQRKLLAAYNGAVPEQCSSEYGDTRCELNAGHNGNHRRRIADSGVSRSWAGR